MDETIIIYEKSTCSKCMLAEQILRDRGIPFKRVEYYETPFTREKIKDLLTKIKMSPRDLLRTNEAEYHELGIEEKIYSDDDLVDLMVEHPNLIQRPIIEKGDRAVLARPLENLDALLK